ncbi:MAG: twin-arginine translocation signal domain-containing protein [Candidatus Hydrogenedentota bacterium]
MGFRRSRREFLSYATVADVGALAGLALPPPVRAQQGPAAAYDEFIDHDALALAELVR